MGSARKAWYAWTACLAIAPTSMYDWLGPLVPGPSDVVSLAIPLAVLAVLSIARGGASRLRPSERSTRTLLVVGSLSAMLYLAMRAVGWSYRLFDGMPFSLFAVVSSLWLPIEILAVTCWMLLLLCLSAGKDEASAKRVAVLFLASAAFPFLVLVVNAIFSGKGFPASLAIFGQDAFNFRSVLACVLFGLLALAGLIRLGRDGFSVREVVALLCGSAAFRAWAEVVRYLPPPLVTGSFATGLFLLGSLVLVTLALAGIMTLGCAARPSPHETAEVTSEDVAPALLSGLPGCELLTERERVVLEESLSGLTGREIATKCGISESTVATYRKRGYGKLRVLGMGDLKRLLESRGGEGALSSEGELAEKTPTEGLGRWQRFAVAVVLVLLVALVPPGYVPLSVSPYGMDVSRVMPFLVGLILVAAGLARWRRAEREGRPCVWPANVRIVQDTRVRLIVLGMSALSAGMMIGYAWLTPLPWPPVPEAAMDFLTSRLWAAFGLVVLLIGAGEFGLYRLMVRGGVRKARMLVLRGMSAVVLRVPQCLVLVGAGLLLDSVDVKLSSINLLDSFYLIHQLYGWIPRLFSLLLMALVIMSEIGYGARPRNAVKREDLEGQLHESGLSSLQVQVVMLSLGGSSCSEIAAKLNLAPGTVRSYRSRACKLLGVGSIDELCKLT